MSAVFALVILAFLRFFHYFLLAFFLCFVGVRVQKVRANIVGGPTHVDTDTKSPMDHQSGQQKAFGNGNGGSYKTRTRSLSLSLSPPMCLALSFCSLLNFFFYLPPNSANWKLLQNRQ